MIFYYLGCLQLDGGGLPAPEVVQVGRRQAEAV